MDNNNKPKLPTFDNSKSRDTAHRKEYQLSQDFVQNYEIDRATNDLSLDEAIELLEDLNIEANELLNEYEKDKTSAENIQSIRNLYNNIHFGLQNRRSVTYLGIKPYTVINDSKKFAVSKLLEILSSEENNVEDTQNKDFVKEVESNIASLKKISETYLDKEASDFIAEVNLGKDYTTSIENDVNDEVQKSLKESLNNKQNNATFDYDTSTKGSRKKYAAEKNKELNLENKTEKKEKKLVFNDEADQSKITNIPVEEPSEKLNLDKAASKSMLKRSK